MLWVDLRKMLQRHLQNFQQRMNIPVNGGSYSGMGVCPNYLMAVSGFALGVLQRIGKALG